MWSNLKEVYLQSIIFSKRACRRQFLLCVIGLLDWGLFALLLHKFWEFDLRLWAAVECVIFLWMMVRRCHDVGRPWFFSLIPGYVVVLLFKDSEVGTNDWGMDMKYEYTLEDFEDIDAFYKWRERRPTFKRPIVLPVLQKVMCAALLLGVWWGTDVVQSFMQYESAGRYYDMECSMSVRFSVPDDVDVGGQSVRDIMFLTADGKNACVYEDADGEDVCGVKLVCDADKGFDRRVWEQMKETAVLTESVKYSRFEFIKDYLAYFEE